MPGEPPLFDADFRSALDALIGWRRDVRRFRTDPISEDLLAELLSLANLAPSVGNSQPWRWVRVEDAERRAGVIASFEACNSEAAEGYDGGARDHYLSLKLAGLREAPVHFAVFTDMATAQGRGLGKRTMPETLHYSSVMSVHTFWLAARARGVGVGWVSILDPDAVTGILDVPEDWQFVGYLCVGFPLEEHEDPELVRAHWQDRVPLRQILR